MLRLHPATLPASRAQGSVGAATTTGMHHPGHTYGPFLYPSSFPYAQWRPGSSFRFRETPGQPRTEKRHGIPRAHRAVSFLGHQDGHLPVGGELDLSPSDRVHLHYLIGQGVEVEEGTDFAAEGTCLVLVQGQLQVAGRGQLGERKKTGNTWSPRAPRLQTNLSPRSPLLR